METFTRKNIRKIVHNYCKPLIIMALKSGFTYKDVSEVLKESFVNAAGNEFGLRGRPANVSRIAILTGVSRKEVRRIRSQPKNSDGGPRPASPLSKILSAWHNDPKFLDDSGLPTALSYKGKTSSFSALAKEYVGDIPASALLKELELHGFIEETVEGKIRPVAQAFIAKDSNVESLERLGEVVGELGGTIVKNLAKNEKTNFERRVLTGRISHEESRAFHNLVRKQGRGFLEFMDAWLFERGLSDVSKRSKKGRCRAGVGIYFFEEEVG